MEGKQWLIPPGPEEKYRSSDDLLGWMARQFQAFGDTYKAYVYGTSMYGTRDVEFAHHVLVENWQNYVKGQGIRRVALLLGNGLMVSKGELWKRQRRMIQPAFHQESVATAIKPMCAVNAELLRKWTGAARRNESVNVTRDVSRMALEVVLRFVFGDDYELASSHFSLVSQEPARNMEFAFSFRALGGIVLEIATRRGKNGVAVKDVLGLLMQARDPQSGEQMGDAQLVDEVLTLIVAGQVYTSDVFAKPSVAKKNLGLEVTLHNPTNVWIIDRDLPTVLRERPPARPLSNGGSESASPRRQAAWKASRLPAVAQPRRCGRSGR